ncbi:uncharacterized protein LOC143559207 [Bidens hawaiensis]|uniref:uncharacterized protein LOC143559207 n=1 Tax=Bidens hawaiensis TaxID=980011 RepID=UPI00404A3BD7
MEHFKSRSNDYFHFTNPHDDLTDFDDDASQYYDDDDDDDDRSCDFSFHTYHPLGINRPTPSNSQTSGVMNRNDIVEFVAFDNEALICQLDNTMKNISDKLNHKIESIGTQISHLEDETCKLDNHVEDVKNSDERYHGTTHRKLRWMQSILQEVQDGVLYLRDKHELSETQLQLNILHGSMRDKINIAPSSSCNTPIYNRQSNELNLPQAVSYHPVVFQAHELTAHQYAIPPHQQSHTPPQKKPDLQFPHFAYTPEFTSFSNTCVHGELSSSYETSHVKPVESFLHRQEESSRSNYINTPVSQTLPHALPTAIDVIEESRSDENGDTFPVDDVVDMVTGMGFRRDLVRACVRKLTVNESRVDLNSVLDKMMNK